MLFEPQAEDIGWKEPLEHSDATNFAFRIAGIYEDILTQNWAMQMCQPLRQKFGKESIQHTWHDVHSLGDHQFLMQAVRAALAADVIVIAVQAAEELPPELCAWIDVWLPRRHARVGALATFVGVAGQPDTQAVRTQNYLEAVARRGELDFVPHERRFPAATDVSPVEWVEA